MKGQGAYQLVFTKWLEQMKNNDPLIIFGDGRQTRDFTHISDTVQGLILAMENKHLEQFDVINLGSGKETSINALAKLFKHKVKHAPARLFEERFKRADIRKAKRLLGWKPKISIEEGVQELLTPNMH
jgi:UDP-glucose 4-epimerase